VPNARARRAERCGSERRNGIARWDPSSSLFELPARRPDSPGCPFFRFSKVPRASSTRERTRASCASTGRAGKGSSTSRRSVIPRGLQVLPCEHSCSIPQGMSGLAGPKGFFVWIRRRAGVARSGTTPPIRDPCRRTP
jgi:hypothetical protein